MNKPVILTGLRANNDLTIGNYLGALLPMIDMAKRHAGEYQVNLFVPDLHSFTTPIDHSKLYEQVLHNIKVYVAAGLPIDHDDVHVYRQSYVPAHSELTWILDCFTGFGEMGRMTQFKDKSGLGDFNPHVKRREIMKTTEAISHTITDIRNNPSDALFEKLSAQVSALNGKAEGLVELHQKQERVSVGLFNYPVLMAADILLYNASYVPVGDDQTQHLEFTRDIATRMNNQFGELFTVPLPVPKQHAFFGKDQGLRVRDLADPTKKMSKSDETGKGVIFLSDTPDAATKKIMSAATDSFGEIKFDMQERPGVTNLLQILALLTGHPQAEVTAEWEGKASYGDLKKAVAQAVAAFLEEFQSRLAAVDEGSLLNKLESSEQLMRQTAGETLLRAQRAAGLRPGK
jgi:tryptophanyl-tRNA synthetase